jgi:hypothetical protein
MKSSKTVIVYTCSHAKPEATNERFNWLGDFIEDIKPDYVVDLGDGADMCSLNSYDTRSPKAIVSQSYEEDIDSYNDSQDRIWSRYSLKKKRRPFRIGFEGNHENRIKKALSIDPRLEGSRFGISFKHLQTDHWFDEYHEYSNSAPALVAYDDILYGHYVGAGAYGRALSGIHHGYALTAKLACSATVGHSHKFSYHRKTDARPNTIHGLVAGCFKGKDETWAGQSNNEFSRGVAVKRYVSNGDYDLQWVSMEALQREYG